MTVKQLIEKLQRHDPTDEVLVYDRDMKEHTNVEQVGRRTRMPICVEIITGRN